MTEYEGTVLIDRHELAYVGCAALRAIVIVARTPAKRNVKFRPCYVPEPIADVFRISGFDRIIPIHSSRVDALAAVGD